MGVRRVTTPGSPPPTSSLPNTAVIVGSAPRSAGTSIFAVLRDAYMLDSTVAAKTHRLSGGQVALQRLRPPVGRWLSVIRIGEVSTGLVNPTVRAC